MQVGRFTQGQSNLRRPPTIQGEGHKLHNSWVDNPQNPNIYIIFDRNQCYPNYLIRVLKINKKQHYLNLYWYDQLLKVQISSVPTFSNPMGARSTPTPSILKNQ